MPDGLKPSNKAHWCDYATDWIDIKVKWDLTATELEWTALQEMIGTCEQPLLVIAIPSQMQSPSPKPVAKSVPTKSIKVLKFSFVHMIFFALKMLTILIYYVTILGCEAP